jgi:hypothetical protein
LECDRLAGAFEAPGAPGKFSAQSGIESGSKLTALQTLREYVRC